jgi:hypothetical protein
MDSLYSITVFNMIFEWLPHLCTPHTQLSVKSLSRAVNFKQIQPKRSGRFSNASQRAPIGRWVQIWKKKSRHLIPLWAWWSYYTLDGVSIHPVTAKIQASFLTQLPERKESAQGLYHASNGDFKTEFNGCDRRKLRMDQQHCSYSTILS